jgi:cell wall-associated NlpC family hydrolase
MRTRIAAAAAAALCGLAVLASSPAALAAPARHHPAVPRRDRAMNWAVSQHGHPYVWGGTGPGFDCSGLVMMACRHAGIHLPRTTYEMLASPLLIQVTHPERGDLAFYGSGHVELVTRQRGVTFGAHDQDSPVGWIRWSSGWHPTAFYRVKGAR